MQKADRQLVRFAFIVCVTCSVLLSGVAAGLRERQEREVELDRKRNVLIAFGVESRDETGRRISAERVAEIFADNVGQVVIDPDTGEELPDSVVEDRAIRRKQQLPLFYWMEDGERQRYTMPISGDGLWGRIYGYLALEDDLMTIAGITFFDHNETPGLGAEIERDWYQEQFRGKQLMADGDLKEFRSIRGGVESQYPDGNPHAVDGISGATITSESVAKLITEDFRRYNIFFKRLRDG